MRRKIALLLCLTLITAIVLAPIKETEVYAADRAAEVINAIGIMETDKGNTNIGTNQITRGRFAQMLVNLSTFKDDVTSECNISLFKDVKKSYWAAGYIQEAITKGWMFGYLDGTFKPDKGITLQEAVYGVIQLLGYTNNDFSGNKVNAIMNLYKTKGLNKTISKTKTDYITVTDCIYLFLNTLNATTKDGKVYASVLGYTLDSSGKLDYLSLINKDISGPIIVDENWQSELPFSAMQATIYKYGVLSTYADIKDYDVIYYSEIFKTIWVYDDKVTGTVDTINPNYLAPQSVTISGKDYTFEDSDVALKFSSLGDVKVGDDITLLLGKEGAIADILSIDEYNTTITGVVLEVGMHLVEDKSGDYESKSYVTYVDATGSKYTQDYDKTTVYLMAGEIVRATYVEGVATISQVILDKYSFGTNTFNSDASSLGNTKLASNVKILDLKDGQYISIYPKRLAGVTLGSSTIYYFELNDNGAIEQLILKDVTGDMDQYGVSTGYTISNSNKIDYSYLIGGTKGVLSTSVTGIILGTGPMGFVFENNAIKESYALSEIPVTSIAQTYVLNNNVKLPLADKSYVYLLVDGEYILTTLDKISNLSKYKVKAYYDSPVTSGGRIRVIVAESIQ